MPPDADPPPSTRMTQGTVPHSSRAVTSTFPDPTRLQKNLSKHYFYDTLQSVKSRVKTHPKFFNLINRQNIPNRFDDAFDAVKSESSIRSAVDQLESDLTSAVKQDLTQRGIKTKSPEEVLQFNQDPIFAPLCALRNVSLAYSQNKDPKESAALFLTTHLS